MSYIGRQANGCHYVQQTLVLTRQDHSERCVVPIQRPGGAEGLAAQTRSGAAFSPWESMGTPIVAPSTFVLEDQIKAATARQELAVLQGANDIDSDEEDIPLATILSNKRPAPLPHTPASDEVLDAHSDTPAHSVPVAGPPTSSDFDDTLTKEQYHAKKRSKARRRAARARTLSNAAGEPGITKRSVKEVALKRRSAAVTLSASIDIGPEVRRVLDADNASSSAIGAEPIPTNYSLAMEDVPVTKTAFTSTRKEATEEDRREYTKEELIARGFEYVPWDGRCVPTLLSSPVPYPCDMVSRVPRPILDQHGRVFAVLAGRPRDNGWDEVNAQLQEILETTREAYRPQPKQTNHRRGAFTAVSCGFSYGGGQTVWTQSRSLQ